MAFMMWKQCFGRSSKCKNIFFFLITSFIDKFVVLDPGFIVKLMKGIPSGHPFTTLIGSMVNWIVWSTIFMKYCERTGDTLDDRFKVIVSGDDSMVRVPMDVDEDILMDCIRASGLKCDTIVGQGTGF